jgi:hypothetical protein
MQTQIIRISNPQPVGELKVAIDGEDLWASKVLEGTPGLKHMQGWTLFQVAMLVGDTRDWEWEWLAPVVL